MKAEIFGLFLQVCALNGACEYVPQGWVYPDEANCLADMRQQRLQAPQYECFPIEGILEQPAGFDHAG